MPPNVNVVWEPLTGTSQELAITSPCDITMYHGARGPGKDVEVNTPVLTDCGWKKANDVTYDDKLVALDGSHTRILGIYPKTNRPMWRVEFHSGDVVIADSEHRWKVLNGKTGYREGWKVRTTAELAACSTPFSVPYLEGPMEGPQWRGLDPYWIGYMIANGTTKSARLCAYTIDDEILEYAESLGWYRWSGEQTAQRAICPDGQAAPWRAVIPNEKGDAKHVPSELLWASPADRLALLQGLMDGDGNVESGAKSRYTTVSIQLAKDVEHLVKSLGGWAKVSKKYDDSGFGSRGWRYVVNISHHNKFNPFRLTRKADAYTPQKTHLTRGIKSITFSHYGEGVCFAIEHESHCFVISDWVITHNTITQLMRFRSRVGQGYGSYWRGVIFDREFKNLGDLVAQSRRFFPKFDDGCKFLSRAQEYKWVWPTGEELLFRHVKKLGDYDGFHGWEIPFLGWNELTKHPTSELYDKLMSINRSSYTVDKDGWVGSDTGYGPNGELPPPIPLEVFITTNPSGPGHNWVKRQFIDPAPNGTIVRKEAAIFNPQTQQDETYVKTQVAIFGSYRENKFLDPKYIAELDAITNENLRRAWLYGDWNVTAGGALDDLWNERKHVLPRFPIPRNWRIDRSMDWGSTHPFACAWWAECNGEEVILPDGRTFAPAKGSIIQIAELYATEAVGSNKGLKWSPTLCAEKIVEKEKSLLQNGWIETQPYPGPADNQIRNVIDSESDTIETKFAKKGVKWTESDKSPGSRKNGLILLRDRLEAVISKPELPGLYVMTHCRDSIDTVTSIQYDEDNVEDVDTNSEDHMYDAWRYRCLKGANRIAAPGSVKIRMPT